MMMVMVMMVAMVVMIVVVIIIVVVFENGDSSDFDFDTFYDWSVEFDAFGMINFVGTEFCHEKSENYHAHDHL